MRAITCLCFLALAACAAPPSIDDEAPIEPRPLPGPSESGGEGLADAELCDADDYRSLVGSPAADANLIVGPELRVFGVNDIITQDYLPQRTNVVSDTDGLILRVYCG